MRFSGWFQSCALAIGRGGVGACDGLSRGAPHGARGDAGVRAGRRRSAGWRPGMTAEFPLIVTLADAAQGRAISVEADAGARAAIARRLGLVALDRKSTRLNSSH